MAQRAAKQALGGLQIARFRQAILNRGTLRIDRPIQIAPVAFDPDVRFIHAPGPVGRLQMRAQPEQQFRGEALDPTPDSGVIDTHAAFSQQLLHIAIRQANTQLPPNRAENDLRLELPLLEDHGASLHRLLQATSRSLSLCNTTTRTFQISMRK